MKKFVKQYSDVKNGANPGLVFCQDENIPDEFLKLSSDAMWKLIHRNEAKISVFDSVVQGGDSVWEGIRVYDGRIFCLDKHLKRLMESAKSMDFRDIPSVDEVKNAIFIQ